jgi:para-nitrobenzyl esterase
MTCAATPRCTAGPDGVSQYLGVPYAEPPVGKLRFQPPVTVSEWSGVRNTTVLAPGCLQPDGPSAEDCLYLNVFVPTVNASGPLNVMLWIHGGSYVSGSAANPVYSGEALAAGQGVIVVTIQYR